MTAPYRVIAYGLPGNQPRIVLATTETAAVHEADRLIRLGAYEVELAKVIRVRESRGNGVIGDVRRHGDVE